MDGNRRMTRSAAKVDGSAAELQSKKCNRSSIPGAESDNSLGSSLTGARPSQCSGQKEDSSGSEPVVRAKRTNSHGKLSSTTRAARKCRTAAVADNQEESDDSLELPKRRKVSKSRPNRASSQKSMAGTWHQCYIPMHVEAHTSAAPTVIA